MLLTLFEFKVEKSFSISLLNEREHVGYMDSRIELVYVATVELDYRLHKCLRIGLPQLK